MVRAFDVVTASLIWEQQSFERGMIANLTGAPRIFDGKVIVGFGGADYAKVRGYITAYDAMTGRKLWGFDQVPHTELEAIRHYLRHRARTGGGTGAALKTIFLRRRP